MKKKSFLFALLAIMVVSTPVNLYADVDMEVNADTNIEANADTNTEVNADYNVETNVESDAGIKIETDTKTTLNGVETFIKAGIQPRLTYIMNARNSLLISDIGEASIGNHMVCLPSVTRCEIYAVLERKVNGVWAYFMSWSRSRNADSLDFTETHYLVRGSYRVVTTVTAYAGSKSETVTFNGVEVVH